MGIWFNGFQKMVINRGLGVENNLYDTAFRVVRVVNEGIPREHMFHWTRPQDCASFDEFEVCPLIFIS